MHKQWVFLFFVLSFSHDGLAKNFKNSYINFDLPDRWECELKKTAYLCRHRISKQCRANPTTNECKKQIRKSQEALIVLSAKEKSKIDSMAAFKEHFGTTRKFNAAGGSSQSNVIHNKIVGIKRQKWVDTMHLGSELPHYYTRYLATAKGKVAVLISFTAHKLYYTNYSSQFFNGIKSLKVTASDLSKIKKDELGDKILSRPIDIPEDLLSSVSAENERSDNAVSTLMFLLSMILAGTGLFIWFKSKKAS